MGPSRVAAAVGFDSVDRTGVGLVELPVFDHFGLIWVVPSPRHEPIDIDAWFAPLEENLGGLNLGEHHSSDLGPSTET